MENHHFHWVNQLSMAIFKSFLYVYQRLPISHHVVHHWWPGVLPVLPGGDVAVPLPGRVLSVSQRAAAGGAPGAGRGAAAAGGAVPSGAAEAAGPLRWTAPGAAPMK